MGFKGNQFSIPVLTLVLSLCCTGFLPAQKKDDIRFERFTIEQGLSSDRVFSITQDNQGYIWVGTEAGVCRYDGYTFSVYRNIPGDSTSLVNNQVNALKADRSGTLWIGTQNGLSRFNAVTETFNNINHITGDNHTLPGRVVKTILESTSGVLWFGTDNGLARYEPETGHFISNWQSGGREASLEGVSITSISEDKNGSLWIGTNNRGLIKFDPSTSKTELYNDPEISGASFPTTNVSKVLVASSGEIWIGFLPQAGLGRYNPVTRDFKLYKQDSVKYRDFWNYISDIIETRDHTIWVGTFLGGGGESGLHRYDAGTDQFIKHTHSPFNPASLSWAYVQTIFEDRYHNLWVGTSRGLNKADLKRWQMGLVIVNAKDTRNLVNNFYAIEEVDDDLYWLGLDGDGLIEWDRKADTKKHLDPINIRLHEGIHALQKDTDGSIWIGLSGKGLVKYDRNTRKSTSYINQPAKNNSVSGNFITDLLLDRTGTLWIATSDGLSRFNRDKGDFTTWRHDEKTPGMTGNSLSTLFEDSHGYIWIGTKEHVYDPSATVSTGLMRFDPKTGSFKSYRHDQADTSSLSSDAVRCIGEDRNGNIWVGTNNGLNRLDPNTDKFDLFLQSDALPDPNVIGILVDNQGILWLSTLKGISRFDPATKVFRNYTSADGIQAYRYNENSFYKTRQGELIFGGIAGANYFQPSEISQEPVIPGILISRFLKQNIPFRTDRPIDKIEKINLKWNDNSIGFEYVAINYRTSAQTLYQYKLDGFDKKWIAAGTRRYVNYTNLPAGDYTFRVRAINSEGVKTEQDATLAVKISPPFWLTWYAFVFYGLLVLLSAFSLDRYQRHRLIARERERSKDRELEQAHEIEKAYTELKATQSQLIQSEKMASLGELTAGIAHEIQNPLNFVNNFSEVGNELIDEMNEELAKGNLDDVKAISADLKQNLEKINHHGKRADSIVKGMLQHSRASNGVKEPADINALADEYLRLSYHGLRARDKSFNASFNTDFDETIGKISIIPQDIGRVLLNLLTNAFYAVTEKKNLDIKDYEPMVSVSTKKAGNRIEIIVRDNGNGIPPQVLDKIFYPFFTTKPTGQGTGLGLSMSYDIITKGHQGELKVKTEQDQGSEFIIILNS